jgi:hypothetical protein
MQFVAIDAKNSLLVCIDACDIVDMQMAIWCDNAPMGLMVQYRRMANL